LGVVADEEADEEEDEEAIFHLIETSNRFFNGK
jgi:hypothetical protein